MRKVVYYRNELNLIVIKFEIYCKLDKADSEQ